ncbi:hypothetical protein CCACVL1_27244, partial [Corchorus capsularis]
MDDGRKRMKVGRRRRREELSFQRRFETVEKDGDSPKSYSNVLKEFKMASGNCYKGLSRVLELSRNLQFSAHKE